MLSLTPPDGWDISMEADDLEEESHEYQYTYSGGTISCSISKITDTEYRIFFWHNNTTSELVEETAEEAITTIEEHMNGITDAPSPYSYFDANLYQPDDRW